jgi:succinoglycan biosynthesis transport protein ExoP
MSRNFELLERTAEEELLTPGSMPEILRPPIPFPALKGPAKEEITKLVQRLFFHGGRAGGPKIVSFSGIARDDRSSWICARAAECLAAQADASVCLVDANFSSPRLHNHYDVVNRTGLAAALTADGPIKSFATQLPVKNLWLLPSGSAKPGLDANVARCRARFAELREEFAHVLVSAPSLARESEASLMGQLADGIVLIIEANHSRRDTVRQAKEHLDTAQVQILGAVLDQRRFPIPEFLYRRI